MLARLGKPYDTAGLQASVEAFKEAAAGWLRGGELDHVAFGFHLLLGYPGENEASVAETCELINRARPRQVAVQLGVRVYPHTPWPGAPGASCGARKRTCTSPCSCPWTNRRCWAGCADTWTRPTTA